MVKKRDYKSNSKLEETLSGGDAGKLLTDTEENEELMKETGYRTVAEMYLKDDKFKLKNSKGEYILDKNGNKQIKIRNSINGYKNTVLRKLLVDEIKMILEKQKQLNSNVNDDFIKEYLEI